MGKAQSDLFDATMAVENGEDDDGTAMQKLINEGSAWKFQGSFGRSMMEALESGRAMLGKKPTSDYYGNRIPSRDEVLEGTKGSYGLVEATMGSEYADKLKAL